MCNRQILNIDHQFNLFKYHFSVGTLDLDIGLLQTPRGTWYPPGGSGVATVYLKQLKNKGTDTCKACKDRLRNTRNNLEYPIQR